MTSSSSSAAISSLSPSRCFSFPALKRLKISRIRCCTVSSTTSITSFYNNMKNYLLCFNEKVANSLKIITLYTDIVSNYQYTYLNLLQRSRISQALLCEYNIPFGQTLSFAPTKCFITFTFYTFHLQKKDSYIFAIICDLPLFIFANILKKYLLRTPKSKTLSRLAALLRLSSYSAPLIHPKVSLLTNSCKYRR